MHKLYKQNKITSPDQSQTWLHILRKPSQTYIDMPYNVTSTEHVSKDTDDTNTEFEDVNDAGNAMAHNHDDVDTDPLDPSIDFNKEEDELFIDQEPSQPSRKYTKSRKILK